jgi:hypothetical protein
LSIRFQADNDLKRIIVDATLRREPRIDFQTAQAARLPDAKADRCNKEPIRLTTLYVPLPVFAVDLIAL